MRWFRDVFSGENTDLKVIAFFGIVLAVWVPFCVLTTPKLRRPLFAWLGNRSEDETS